MIRVTIELRCDLCETWLPLDATSFLDDRLKIGYHTEARIIPPDDWFVHRVGVPGHLLPPDADVFDRSLWPLTLHVCPACRDKHADPLAAYRAKHANGK